MGDSFEKKEREKKKAQKRKEKLNRKKELKEKKDSGYKEPEFMYVGSDGQLTSEKPDTFEKEEISLDDIVISTPKKEQFEEEEFEKIGIVKFFNTEKGYGFITEKGSSDSIFVHINSIEGEIKEGNKVSFKVEKGPKGLVAVEVKLYKA